MSATESPAPTPLRDGPDVSWIPHCHPGDSQGQIGACSVFAIASWVEVMFQRPIDDSSCISAYREERRRRYGGGDDGLTIPEAFFAAVTAGIVPSGCYCRRVPDLAALPLAPLVAVYRSTRGWYTPNAAGCVDHTDEAAPGFHAVLLVAHGQIRAGSPSASSHKVIWIENSWGRDWGYMGFGVMTEAYHRAHLDSLWQIVRHDPDSPCQHGMEPPADGTVACLHCGSSFRARLAEYVAAVETALMQTEVGRTAWPRYAELLRNAGDALKRECANKGMDGQ